MTKENVKVIREAVMKYGAKHQQIVAIEELSELQKELTKALREDQKCSIDYNHIAEEVADIYIMLHEVMAIYCITEEVGKWIDIKVKRLEQRLSQENSDN